MTMRATIERSPDQGTNDRGRPSPPIYAELSGQVPCRVWVKDRKKDVNNVGKIAVVEDMRGIFPPSADVRRHDRLTITNRLGAVQFGGPIAVLTDSRRGAAGSSPGHVEFMLERHL